MNNRRNILAMGLAFVMAAAGIQATQIGTQAKAVLSTMANRESRRLGLGVGGRSPQRHYSKKPWTCTAIEKRKAAKRRNVIRARKRA